jgi:uncharacterized membrane protein YfcA
MSSKEAIGLVLAAATGGAINAVAGGGTLVTFPTLLFFGMPAINANATSTLALVLGTSGSILGFRQHLPAVKSWLWRFIPVSFLGGLLGSILLTCTSERTFSKLVPFLIFFATILFLLQGLIKRLLRTAPSEIPEQSSFGLWGAMGFQFLMAIYGGYFGAGIGILMLATLGFLGFRNIHEMNTVKTVLGSLINLVAAIWFVRKGLIYWPEMSLMTAGALVGYYLGAHFSQQISQQRVRQIITFIGFVLSVIMFYKEFVSREK